MGSEFFFECRVLMTKKKKNLQIQKIKFFKNKNYFKIYLSLGLQKGSPSYRRNLQPSKENIQHFIT
jgi:hypothetical protein